MNDYTLINIYAIHTRMQSSLDYVFYAGLLLFTSGANGEVTIPPMNTAAEVGGQTVFDCTSDASSPNWVFSTNREEFEAPSGQNIVIGCMVQPAFATHYDVDRLGGSSNKCNLIVKAITLQQAGVYTCTDITSRLSSVLTVIARNTSIAVSSQPQTVEGETVRMSYAVTYNSSIASSITPTIKPVLSWTDSDGNIVTSSPASTANSVSSSISVTAGRQDIRPYTCHISYTSPSTKPSFATNSPSSVSNSPSTSTINVLYAPIISSITMNQDVPVCPGKTVEITCHATANPAPNYSWIGPDSRTYSGETIEAAMNGVYNCTASNNIRGSAHSDTNYATLNVLCWFWLLLLLWILNPIAAAIFLVHYKYSQVRNDYNERYLFLSNMLPCMNNSQETPCRKAAWITLFVVMVIFSGIQFLILTIVTYAGCRKKGKGRVDGNVCGANPGTTQRKYARKSIDETAMQKIDHNTKQTKQKKVSDKKSETGKAGKSTDQNQTTNDASEEQSIASHATGTRFQKICFALALAYMILGMILFAISVGVIYYECNRQCNK